MKEKIIALKGYVRNCLTGYKESKEKVQKKYVIEAFENILAFTNDIYSDWDKTEKLLDSGVFEPKATMAETKNIQNVDYSAKNPFCPYCGKRKETAGNGTIEELCICTDWTFYMENKPTDSINHPAHYTDGKIEVIDFIEDKKFGFNLGNAVKYISRAGKKDKTKTIEDLKKAIWYINREIQNLEK